MLDKVAMHALTHVQDLDVPDEAGLLSEAEDPTDPGEVFKLPTMH